jgi:adenine-specific DNA-methyltransferase
VTATVEELIDGIENRRQAVASVLDAKHRSRLGQFFTPAPTARFLAELLELPRDGEFRLLDPGAGVGSLSAAVVARVLRERPKVSLHITAFEIDSALVSDLRVSLAECEEVAAAVGGRLTYDVRELDFIAWASAAARGSMFAPFEPFDACVMNPPYRKISNGGADRFALERVGVRVTNLYTGFLALAACLLKSGGQLSAITPRSFTNGPYFEPFRSFFLSRMAINRLHVYERRGALFSDADVLQENVVLHARREGPSSTVTLSTSTSDWDMPVNRSVPYEEVIHPGDQLRFIRIPLDERDTRIAEQIASLPASLADLKLEVSTGRVVDFRSRESLRQEPVEGTVPLIYPSHLQGGTVDWPTAGSKKPNALHRSCDTEPLLLPNESYVLVKRFSAKEERRRVVAAVSSPEVVPGPCIAFENHLNVYHRANRGLSDALARGLAAFLNSSLVDQYVRQFNGHTQINATDLRGLRYPEASELERLGRVITPEAWNEQDEIDRLVRDHVRALGRPPSRCQESEDGAPPMSAAMR